MSRSLSDQRLHAIIETQSEIAAAPLDAGAVMSLVVRRAQALLGAAAGVVEVLEGEEMVYKAVSGTAADHLGLRLQASGTMSGLCVAEGRILYCEDASLDNRVDHEACEQVGAVSMLCVPLTHGDRVVGVLKVYDPRPSAFGAEDVETLRLLSNLIAAHMAHASEYESQRHASRHDSLTGLPNRRDFDRRIASEAARTRRYGDPVALCLFDLDGFKQVNDALGEAEGDEVLRGVARQMDRLRGEDAAFRLCGDEFALILVGASELDGAVVAERVDTAVREDPACRGVGFSWGIATLASGDPVVAMAAACASLDECKRRRHGAA